MEVVSLILMGVGGLTTLVCSAIVCWGIMEQKGILWALFGFFCCTLYALIFGFTEWRSPRKGLIMPIFCVGLVLSIVGQVIARM